jgi:hypothetical protein
VWNGERIAPRYPGLKIDDSDISCIAKQVPALWFFSGLHGDYHTPGDTWEKIDAEHAAEVLQLVADLAARIDSDETRPEFPLPAPAAKAGTF